MLSGWSSISFRGHSFKSSNFVLKSRHFLGDWIIFFFWSCTFSGSQRFLKYSFCRHSNSSVSVAFIFIFIIVSPLGNLFVSTILFEPLLSVGRSRRGDIRYIFECFKLVRRWHIIVEFPWLIKRHWCSFLIVLIDFSPRRVQLSASGNIVIFLDTLRWYISKSNTMILAEFFLFLYITFSRSVLVVPFSFGWGETLSSGGLLIGLMHIRYNYV